MRAIDLLYILLTIYTFLCNLKSKEVFGVWQNHYVLTNAFWILSLGLSLYFNDYVRPVSDNVYLIFFIGLFVFNITLFTSNIQRIPDDIYLKNDRYSIIRRRSLEILVLIVVFPIAYTNYKLIQSGVELWQINNDYWHENRGAGLYILNAIEQNIVSPLMYVLMATCFYTLYDYKKKWSIFLTIVIGTLFAILQVLVTGGGRTVIMIMMFIYVLSTFARYGIKNNKVVFKINKSILVLLVIIALASIAWTSLRRGHSEGLSEVLVDRLTLFPALFESYYTKTEICDGYTLGFSMFETPIAFIMYPFKIFGLNITVSRISGIEQEMVYVPAINGYTNAYVSAYLYYMRDFGYLGIFIGPYIVGMIYNFIWNICRKDTFLLLFYFVGIGMTCLDSNYPFRRGFVFILLMVFLYRKFVRLPSNSSKVILK